VPAAEWDLVVALGFDVVWLMSVWERSPGRVAIAVENQGLVESFGRALPGFTPEDVVGSPYCVRDQTVAGGLRPEGLASPRNALERRSLVTNHAGSPPTKIELDRPS
jgi:hypothetical protein